MSDVPTAIRESEARKARIERALRGRPVPLTPEEMDARDDRRFHLSAELEHVEQHLRQQGLSVGSVIRSMAKSLHGADIPAYQPEPDDGE